MEIEQLTPKKSIEKIPPEEEIEAKGMPLNPKLKKMILEKFTAKGFDVEFTDTNRVRLTRNGKTISAENKTILEMMEKN